LVWQLYRAACLPDAPAPQSCKAGAVAGKKRGAALVVDELDSIQIKGRTYRWAAGRACVCSPRWLLGACALPAHSLTACLAGRQGVLLSIIQQSRAWDRD
jgi:type II secretory pathway component PulK